LTLTRKRLGVLLLSLVVLLPVLHKSRAVPRREQAAFVRYTAGSRLVKIVGTGSKDGVYRFNDAVTTTDAKILTLCPARMTCRVGANGEHHLDNGDIVEFSRINGNCYEISVGKMTVEERVQLGIPLDPDRMSASDWETLPGIGPALAQAITVDRQKNGNFGGLEGVLRVPGVGQGKLVALRKYFAKP